MSIIIDNSMVNDEMVTDTIIEMYSTVEYLALQVDHFLKMTLISE